MNNLAGVILAAGKGKRMESRTANKVTLLLGGTPMIVHGVNLLEKLQAAPIVVVVGFAKDSVKKLITSDVVYAEQKKRLGTAHAVSTALEKIPNSVTDVLVVQGDDSAFYEENALREMIKNHAENRNAVTFLTVELSDPFGLGRIIRGSDGGVLKIVEEKEATGAERKISEVNPACYVFNTQFLKKYLPKVTKNPISGEYYLVSLIELAMKNKEKVQAVKGGSMVWRGVNTKEELKEAQKLYSKI